MRSEASENSRDNHTKIDPISKLYSCFSFISINIDSTKCESHKFAWSNARHEKIHQFPIKVFLSQSHTAFDSIRITSAISAAELLLCVVTIDDRSMDWWATTNWGSFSCVLFNRSLTAANHRMRVLIIQFFSFHFLIAVELHQEVNHRRRTEHNKWQRIDD